MNQLLEFTAADYRNAVLGAVAGAALTVILGGIAWLSSLIIRKLKQSVSNNLWKPFFSNSAPGTCAVLTTKAIGRSSGTLKVSLSEVQSFSEIRRTLAKLGVELELIERSDIHLSDLSAKNIVAIGGPKSNAVSREILAAIENKCQILPFEYDATSEALKVGARVLQPELDSGGNLKRDYGVVLRATGIQQMPYACCLVAFGLRGHGTWAAVKALTVNRGVMRKIENEVGVHDFAALLEFDFQSNSLVASRVMFAVRLIAV